MPSRNILSLPESSCSLPDKGIEQTLFHSLGTRDIKGSAAVVGHIAKLIHFNPTYTPKGPGLSDDMCCYTLGSASIDVRVPSVV